VLLRDEPLRSNLGGHGLNGREKPSIIPSSFGDKPWKEPPGDAHKAPALR